VTAARKGRPPTEPSRPPTTTQTVALQKSGRVEPRNCLQWRPGRGGWTLAPPVDSGSGASRATFPGLVSRAQHCRACGQVWLSSEVRADFSCSNRRDFILPRQDPGRGILRPCLYRWRPDGFCISRHQRKEPISPGRSPKRLATHGRQPHRLRTKLA
jgi:hypothetical protein